MHGSTAILQRAIAAQHSKSEFAVIYPLMRTMVNHTMTNSIAQMFIFNAPAGDKVDLIFYFGDPHLQTLTVDEYADELEAAAQHFFTSGLIYFTPIYFILYRRLFYDKSVFWGAARKLTCVYEQSMISS